MRIVLWYWLAWEAGYFIGWLWKHRREPWWDFIYGHMHGIENELVR